MLGTTSYYFHKLFAQNHYNQYLVLRSALVNKLAQPESYVSQLLDATASDQRRLSKEVAVQLGWTLRGLLLRNHPQLVRVVRRVLEVLRSGEPGVADQVNSWFKRLCRISKNTVACLTKLNMVVKIFTAGTTELVA